MGVKGGGDEGVQVCECDTFPLLLPWLPQVTLAHICSPVGTEPLNLTTWHTEWCIGSVELISCLTCL